MYSASSVYGCAPVAQPWVGAPTEALAVDGSRAGWRRLADPRNPLLWLGALLAVTAGLAGVAGSARVGRARASASVGAA